MKGGVCKDKKGLEMGCSNGYSIECLSSLVSLLDVVDGSRYMLDNLPDNIKNNPNINLIYSLFEDLNIIDKYDYIFCSFVLEHVKDPQNIIDICYKMLKSNGNMFITVPNARALSRQMAQKMGLGDIYSLTENDLAHGHRRVFDLTILKKLINNSKFKAIKYGGTYVKPFADFQLNQMIAAEIIGKNQFNGMQLLAEDYPDISGAIYAILKK